MRNEILYVKEIEAVVDLDGLQVKVKDIVLLQEEPRSKRKFLVALGN